MLNIVSSSHWLFFKLILIYPLAAVKLFFFCLNAIIGIKNGSSRPSYENIDAFIRDSEILLIVCI